MFITGPSLLLTVRVFFNMIFKLFGFHSLYYKKEPYVKIVFDPFLLELIIDVFVVELLYKRSCSVEGAAQSLRQPGDIFPEVFLFCFYSI